MRKLVHAVRYFFGFGRHWMAGLPNHEPDMTDPVVADAVATGRESIQLHEARMKAGEKL